MAGTLQGQYQYIPLSTSETQTRVFVLRTGSGSLEGDMEHVRLEDNSERLDYKALSIPRVNRDGSNLSQSMAVVCGYLPISVRRSGI